MSDPEAALANREAELVVDTEPVPITKQKQSIWHWIGVPLAVVVIVLGVVLYIGFAEMDLTSEQSLVYQALFDRTVEHVWITAICTVAVIAIAIPLGILLTRQSTKAAAPFVVGLANIGAAAPSIGLLALFALVMGVGIEGALFGLIAYTVLPVLRNTITGLQGIDPRTVEAGRGMGMSAAMVLFRIELPLAVPVILAGVRTALVLLVGTAALAGFVSAGGLGYFIDLGIKLNRQPVLIVGALLIAALALLIDWIGQLVETFARPKGV